MSRWNQEPMIGSELISSQSIKPIFPYTIGDWLEIRVGTNERSLLSMSYLTLWDYVRSLFFIFTVSALILILLFSLSLIGQALIVKNEKVSHEFLHTPIMVKRVGFSV